MLKYLIAILLVTASCFSQPFPAQPGPVIISQPANGTGTSTGGLDTNAVIALIEEYAGSGGVNMSNFVATPAMGTRYTNTVAPLWLSAAIGLTTDGSAGVAICTLNVDTNLDGTYDFSRRVANNFSIVTAFNSDITSVLSSFVPTNAAWQFEDGSTGGSSAAFDNTAPEGGCQLTYYFPGSGGSAVIPDGSITTNKIDSTFYEWVESGSGSVSAAEVAAIMATNNAGTATTLAEPMLAEFVRLQRFVTNTVNVLDYGAKPDGVTPGNETNFQAAIDAISLLGGGKVFVPPGVYIFGSAIGRPGVLAENLESSMTVYTNNTWIVGGGRDITRIKWGNYARTSTNINNGIGGVMVTNIALMDLTFDGGYLEGNTNVFDMTQFYTNQFLRFERCGFENIRWGEGADSDASQYVLVRDCYFTNCGGGAIGMGGPPGGGGPYIFENNTIFSPTPSRDIGLWADSSAIGATSDTTATPAYTIIRQNTFVGGDLHINCNSYGRTFLMQNEHYPDAALTGSTNVYISGGPVTVSGGIFSQTAVHHGTFIHASAGELDVSGVNFVGKTAITTYGRVNTRVVNCAFSEYARTNTSVRVYGGGHGIYSNNRFSLGAFYALTFESPVTNSIIANNIFSACDVSVSSGSSNNIIIGNTFGPGANLAFYTGTRNLISGNTFDTGKVLLSTSSHYNRFIGNVLHNVQFDTGSECEFSDNTIKGALSGSALASSTAASLWRNNVTAALKPLLNFTITTNYTASAIDTVMLFNGSNLTNTIPSAVTLNKGTKFTIKNLNATALEVTNSTGAQTFDGALRLSLPQYSTRTIMSDGANWQIIGN